MYSRGYIMPFFLRITQGVLQTIDSSPNCMLSFCKSHILPKTKMPTMTKGKIPITSTMWFFGFITLLKISHFCEARD